MLAIYICCDVFHAGGTTADATAAFATGSHFAPECNWLVHLDPAWSFHICVDRELWNPTWSQFGLKHCSVCCVKNRFFFLHLTHRGSGPSPAAGCKFFAPHTVFFVPVQKRSALLLKLTRDVDTNVDDADILSTKHISDIEVCNVKHVLLVVFHLEPTCNLGSER